MHQTSQDGVSESATNNPRLPAEPRHRGLGALGVRLRWKTPAQIAMAIISWLLVFVSLGIVTIIYMAAYL